MCPQRLEGGLVFRQIKEGGHKTVPLPPQLVTILRAHRAAQLAERMRAANVWEDHDLVFAQENGRPIDSRADWQEWAGILKAAGIPHAGTHAMRHSAATIMLELGVPLPVVQEILGHSDIRMTRVYSHVSSRLANKQVRMVWLLPGLAGNAVSRHDETADAGQIRSMIVAVAIAPPAHIETSAVVASRRSSSCRAVVSRRDPVLPTG
jgi:hypothetical protein